MIVLYKKTAVTIASAAFLLAGCATIPLGPTVQVMPGAGKSLDAFQSDIGACKGFAGQQVAGQADAVNKQVAGAIALGADPATIDTQAAQGSIQQQYDMAYAQCMYARGDVVPGYVPRATASARAAAPDPLVRSVQSELIRLNYLNSGADGYMGPRTAGAIREFERSHGMAADGTASRALLARLQSATVGASAATATASAPNTSAASTWVDPVTPAGTTVKAAAPSAAWVAPVAPPSSAVQPVQPVAAPQ